MSKKVAVVGSITTLESLQKLMAEVHNSRRNNSREFAFIAYTPEAKEKFEELLRKENEHYGKEDFEKPLADMIFKETKELLEYEQPKSKYHK